MMDWYVNGFKSNAKGLFSLFFKTLFTLEYVRLSGKNIFPLETRTRTSEFSAKSGVFLCYNQKLANH